MEAYNIQSGDTNRQRFSTYSTESNKRELPGERSGSLTLDPHIGLGPLDPSIAGQAVAAAGEEGDSSGLMGDDPAVWVTLGDHYLT